MTLKLEQKEVPQIDDPDDDAPAQIYPVQNSAALARPKISFRASPLIQAHIEHSRRWREDVNFNFNQSVTV